MTNKKIQKEHQITKLHNASDPFTIELHGEPYVLSQKNLQFYKGKYSQGISRWDRPNVEFISFENNLLIVEPKYNDGQLFKVSIQIEPERLCVSCNCGLVVDGICIHSFHSIESLIRRGNIKYFERFRPNGAVETAFKHPQLIELSTYRAKLRSTPKADLGTVFQFSDKIWLPAFDDIINLPGSLASTLTADNKVLTYILMFPNLIKLKTPTFLLPCLGIKNNAGVNIKSFENFLSGTEKNYEDFLTEDQKILNKLSFEMWKQAENTNGQLLENNEKDRIKLNQLFNLWRKVVPYLQQREYVYLHPFHMKSYLRGKPHKSYMKRIHVKIEMPTLFFELKDKGDYYWLSLRAEINGNPITSFSSHSQFFIECEENFYLVSNFRDVGILEWMGQMDNRITIFKENFEEFENAYLNQLQKHYQIRHS